MQTGNNNSAWINVNNLFTFVEILSEAKTFSLVTILQSTHRFEVFDTILGEVTNAALTSTLWLSLICSSIFQSLLK